MFCSNCGSEIADTAKFCFKCGNKVYENTVPEMHNSNNVNNANGSMNQMPQRNYPSVNSEANLTQNDKSKYIVHLIFGIILNLIGLGLLFFAISSYDSDTSGWILRYTYSPPFTEHEMRVILSGVLGITMGICGTIDIFFAIVKMSATEKNRS